MQYNFDKILDRRGTESLKWDTCSADILPMWVADMDFPVAQPIMEAIKKRVDHGIFGYAQPTDSFYQSACDWYKKRHKWEIKREWLSFSPGIVPALHFFHHCFLELGEKVMMHDPVYYPFFAAANRNNVPVEKVRLLYENGRYEIDFDLFEKTASDPKVKLFILCSPHNPGGRCWSRDELERMAQICIKHNVLIVSDEIHCDLLLGGSSHIPMASLSPEIANHTVTCIAPSKTFNLAGFQTSLVVISNPDIKSKYDKFTTSIGIMRPGTLGITTFEAAYRYGEEWLDQLLVYLEKNLKFLKEFMAEHFPLCEIMEPDATYLIWMDFRKYGIDPVELHKNFLDKGKVWLDEGYLFGESGNYFERINIACPQKTLEEALNRMRNAM